MYPARTFPATGYVCGSCPRSQIGAALPYAAAAAYASTAATLSAIQPASMGINQIPPYQIQVFDPAFYTPDTLYSVTPYVGNTISVATPIGWAVQQPQQQATPQTQSVSAPVSSYSSKASSAPVSAPSSAVQPSTSQVAAVSLAASAPVSPAGQWPIYPRAPPGFGVGSCGEPCVGGSFSPLAPTGVAAWASLLRRVNAPAAAAYGASIASPYPYMYGIP